LQQRSKAHSANHSLQQRSKAHSSNQAGSRQAEEKARKAAEEQAQQALALRGVLEQEAEANKARLLGLQQLVHQKEEEAAQFEAELVALQRQEEQARRESDRKKADKWTRQEAVKKVELSSVATTLPDQYQTQYQTEQGMVQRSKAHSSNRRWALQEAEQRALQEAEETARLEANVSKAQSNRHIYGRMGPMRFTKNTAQTNAKRKGGKAKSKVVHEMSMRLDMEFPADAEADTKFKIDFVDDVASALGALIH
jgi:hypothetical protein